MTTVTAIYPAHTPNEYVPTAVTGRLLSRRTINGRASTACSYCRSKNVRCDIIKWGIPCTKCRVDGSNCAVDTSSKLKTPRLRDHSSQPRGLRHDFSRGYQASPIDEGARSHEKPFILEELLSSRTPGLVGLDHVSHMLGTCFAQTFRLFQLT